MSRKGLCPCGSGKPRAQCCGDDARPRFNPRLIITGVFILVAVGGVTALGLSIAADNGEDESVAATPRSATETALALSPGAQPTTDGTPAPWQYDQVNDRHWNPDHGHWHRGAPPPPEQRVSTPAAATPSSDSPVSIRPYTPPQPDQPSQPKYAADGTVIPRPGGSGRPSKIKNPTDWQYDPESNQHWSPTCWHWHDGQAPPPDQRNIVQLPPELNPSAPPGPLTPANPPQPQQASPKYAPDGTVIPRPGGSGRPSKIKSPTAWQYDPESNQHWSPTCWHWHDGQAPPPEQRPSVTQNPTPLSLNPNQQGPVPTPAITPPAQANQQPKYAPDGTVMPRPGGSGRPSKIKSPTAWQYDPDSNQHWSPTCWHWHEGQPPPPNQRPAAGQPIQITPTAKPAAPKPAPKEQPAEAEDSKDADAAEEEDSGS